MPCSPVSETVTRSTVGTRGPALACVPASAAVVAARATATASARTRLLLCMVVPPWTISPALAEGSLRGKRIARYMVNPPY